MKNNMIIASWNKIEPSENASEHMLCAILEQNRSAYNRKGMVRYMSKKKMMIPIAACLVALIAIAGIAGNNLNWFGGNSSNDAGFGENVDGTVPGGTMPEGIDPVTASIAVYPPAEKSLSDVADATLNEISEEEAYNYQDLGAHLPTSVIDSYHFRNSSVYETTMKDGSKYYLLRVDYTTGDENIADYSILVMNYEPQTEGELLSPDKIPEDISEFFHFKCNGMYFGMSPGDLTYEEIMIIVNSIN